MKPSARALLACAVTLPALAFGSGEAVSFPGADVPLAARLYVPTGKGPFPAVVLMHGCSGLWRKDGKEPTPHYIAWAEHWQGKGFVALLVDSFGPRGEREICTHKDRKIRPERDRPKDAYAALEWLSKRPDVDKAHVHLQGFSNGAMAVLSTVKSDAPGRPAKGPEFRSAVAFYPGCASLLKADYKTVVPLLIQAGGADDWTPAKSCEALVDRSKAAGPLMEIDVYPGAHHAFDGTSPVRSRPEVRNANVPSGWGATVGANPEARAKAFERTTSWIEARNR